MSNTMTDTEKKLDKAFKSQRVAENEMRRAIREYNKWCEIVSDLMQQNHNEWASKEYTKRRKNDKASV
jgi:hypothetical protein